MMLDHFQNKLNSERKKAHWKSVALNALFLFYLGFTLIYLGNYYLNEEAAIPGLLTSLILLASSIVVSLLWSLSAFSTGRLIIKKTNRFLKSEPDEKSRRSWWFSFSGIVTVILLGVTLVLGVQLTEMSFYTLFSEDGINGAKRIFFSLMNPNWDILSFVLTKMVETIFIALMATVIAIPVAFLLSFFSARNLTRSSKTGSALYTISRFLANFTRSVEPIIWAVIFSVWVGIGPFAGMLALMLHSVAALTKLYSEQIESIDHGPIEAIESTGANKVQVVWYAVVPQILLPYLSFTIYRWDINIRMATVIGLVGGGGVGTLLQQYQGLAQWNEVGTIVIVIAVVVWLMDYVSGRLREAIA